MIVGEIQQDLSRKFNALLATTFIILKGIFVKNQSNIRLAYRVFVLSFTVSVIMSFLSQTVLDASTLVFELLILLVIVFIGILFDMVGVAVAVCDPAPFHAMASKRNKVAKIALKLVNKAALVATFSNDVIGDIAGIISGAAIGSIVYNLVAMYTTISSTLISVLLSGLVAGLTVGGKAVGKVIAIEKSKQIIYSVAKTIYYVKYIFTFKWI